MKLEEFIRFIFIGLLSFSATVVFGQQAVVKGKIQLDSGEPASHVTVRVKGTNIIGVSDRAGKYALNGVPYGEHGIELSSVDIEAKTLSIKVHRPFHDFSMKVSPRGDISIESVEVRGKTKKKAIETSGFAVAVIETKEASLRNLTTNELLDRTVGVRVRQNGGVGSSVDYNLNGMSGSTIGIFIDGIEASTYGRSFNLNNIPPSMIERIEVYKGVLPSHLSGNYIGGAINVVMKKGFSQNNLTVAASYGSFGTYNADIGASFRDKKSGFTFRGSGFHTHSDNSYETWGESTTHVNYLGQVTRPFRAKRFNNEYHSTAGRFEAGFTDVKWADIFFLGYNIANSYEEVPHGISMATPYVGRFNESTSSVFSLNYSKRDLLVEGLSLNVNATKSNRNTYLEDTVTFYYNWDQSIREFIFDGERKPIRVRYIDELGQLRYRAQQGEPTMNETKRNILNARSNIAYMFLPGHRLSVNHAFQQTDRDDQDLLRPVAKDLMTTSQTTQNIVTANYEAEFWKRRINTNVQVQYTGDRNNQRRVDYIFPNGEPEIYRRDTSIYTDNVGYSAALAFRFAPHVYLLTSNKVAYVSPTETQLFGELERNIVANVNLKPEKNINTNVGFRTDMIHLAPRHRISFYGSAFWRNGYDKITTETLDADTIDNVDKAVLDVTRYVNIGMTQARGFEAELIYVFNNRLNASFNISRFKNLYKTKSDSEGNPSPYYNELVVNEPYFTMNSNVQYRLDNVLQKKSILNLHYTFGYVHEYNIAWRNPAWGITPTQYVHDVGVSYRFPSQKVVLSVDAKNIFNGELYDNYMKQKPGRGVYVKLNYTINKFL